MNVSLAAKVLATAVVVQVVDRDVVLVVVLVALEEDTAVEARNIVHVHYIC